MLCLRRSYKSAPVTEALKHYDFVNILLNQQVSRVLATWSTLNWEKETPSAMQSTQCACTSGPFPPFQPHCMPLFGSAQNCTININYGNVSQDIRKFDDVLFPENVEKELACIEF